MKSHIIHERIANDMYHFLPVADLGFSGAEPRYILKILPKERPMKSRKFSPQIRHSLRLSSQIKAVHHTFVIHDSHPICQYALGNLPPGPNPPKPTTSTKN